MMLTNDGAVEPKALLCNVGGVSDTLGNFSFSRFHFHGSTILSYLQLSFYLLVDALTKLLIIFFSMSIDALTVIALISTAASKEPIDWLQSCFSALSQKRIYVYQYIILYIDNFFPTRNKNGLQPGSSEQGVLLLTRPQSSGDCLSLPKSRNGNDF